MPATVTTNESFNSNDVKLADVEGERDLRIQAGAIRSTIESTDSGWLLVTEWNVLGSQ